MHPMQLHIRELATEIRKRSCSGHPSMQPVDREWCECQEIRERVLMELGEPAGRSEQFETSNR